MQFKAFAKYADKNLRSAKVECERGTNSILRMDTVERGDVGGE
jgi:hypothetical protein